MNDSLSIIGMISRVSKFFLTNKKVAAPQKIHIDPNLFLFYNDRQVVYYT